MSEANGRGAWPGTGRGGTLKANGVDPGPYYMLAKKDHQQVGLHPWCLRQQGQSLTLDQHAVFHGVVAIQFLLNSYVKAGLKGDGIFGPATDKAVRAAQTKAGLVVDGIVGRNTMKALLLPVIQRAGATYDEPWEPVYGILRFEGALDPGAVGSMDINDLGLAQINIKAHPTVSNTDAFCASFAVNFVAQYIRHSLNVFDNRLRDAIASYNLGHGGTREWISLGRPAEWTPSWASEPRNTELYIDRILNAYRDN